MRPIGICLFPVWPEEASAERVVLLNDIALATGFQNIVEQLKLSIEPIQQAVDALGGCPT